MMVTEAIDEYENKMTKKILQDKNRSRIVWTHIQTLKGNNCIKKPFNLYDAEKEIIKEEFIGHVILQFWQSIYQRHPNNRHSME